MLDSISFYEWCRLAQVILTIYAFVQMLRHGGRAFGRVCESVAVMLVALTGMSLVQVANVNIDEPRMLDWAWLTFDALIPAMVLRVIGWRLRRDRRKAARLSRARESGHAA